MGVSDNRIRILCEQDIPFAMELKNLVGWNQIEEDWKGYLSFEPQGCFLSECVHQRVGTATTIRYEDSLAWIGMVLVHPSARRTGIGTRLLKHCIAYLQEVGIECIKLDATPMGQKVYIPLGFENEYEVSRYVGCVPVQVKPHDDSNQETTSIEEEDMERIIAFDATYFGAERGGVLRRLWKRQDSLCFCTRQSGRITGYVMCRDGTDAKQIGPWVAMDCSAARHLLHVVLSEIAGHKVLVDVPSPNIAAKELMEERSFQVQREFMRMYLGQNRYPGVPENIFSSAGPELG